MIALGEMYMKAREKKKEPNYYDTVLMAKRYVEEWTVVTNGTKWRLFKEYVEEYFKEPSLYGYQTKEFDTKEEAEAFAKTVSWYTPEVIMRQSNG